MNGTIEFKEELVTVTRYKIKGEYTEERAEQHRIIVFDKLKDMIPREKEAILLAGGAGAGKSTVVEEFFLPENSEDDISNFVYIDSDEIKTHLDEYKEYIQNDETVYFAAFYVHDESADIVNMLLQECIEQGLSFIYDGTMSWQPLYDELIENLNSNNYKIVGVYVDVDLEVALERVEKRGKKTRRFVEPEFVKKANRNSTITFRALKPKFNEVLMFNNTEERTDEKETIPFYVRDEPFTEEFKAGQIYNPSQLDLFISKSELPYIK